MVYMLVFYAPEEHVEETKAAVFAVGAGRIGNYDSCCWQTGGTGQFRPLAGSDPAVGEEGRLASVTEVRVELVCRRECLGPAIEALLKAHPYETPAYCYWAVEGVEV